jgi:hypothetical protein
MNSSLALRSLALCAAFTLPLISGGCGSSPQPAEDPTGFDEIDRVLREEGGTAIKLLDAGSEPRIPVRFEARLGELEALVVEIESDVRMGMGDRDFPTFEMPRSRILMELETVEVSDIGTAHQVLRRMDYQVAEEDGLPEAASAEFRREAAGLAGLTGGRVVSNRGVTMTAFLRLPVEASPRMQQLLATLDRSMGQMSIPFPVEAVGPGAHWVVRVVTEVEGVEMTSTFDVRLESMESGSVTLAYTLTGGASRAVRSEGREEHAVSGEESLDFQLEGRSRYELDRLLPVFTSVRGNSSIGVSAEVDGQPQVLRMLQRLALEGRVPLR